MNTHERRHDMGESIRPVCGYDGLDEPAFDERGVGSDDIWTMEIGRASCRERV